LGHYAASALERRAGFDSFRLRRAGLRGAGLDVRVLVILADVFAVVRDLAAGDLDADCRLA
jgi:hypothetical protein